MPLYEAFRRFGFGEPTEIPMPGEATGVLRPKGRPWVQVETAAASYGYGIGVTALQLAMGVATVANGGRLLEPLLIKRVTDGTGAAVREGVPHVRREAMPAAVARTLAEMMVAVTEGQGTGVEAAIAGFRVAGKTATAYKHDPATGKYAADRYTSSFIGFVPAERPRIAVAIVLDEPALAHAGGFVAAPAFRRIGEMSLRYLGVIPKGTPPIAISKVASAPDPAAQMYEAMRQAQAPEPPKEVVTTSAPPPKGTVRLPDLKGMSQREAMKSALDLGLFPALDGTGTLSRQDPAAGTVLPKGARVKLFFEPPT
ncbi:MAG: penicillin-binding transpeptidase domain-containing protein, partial [Polyangiaceae bacterium]